MAYGGWSGGQAQPQYYKPTYSDPYPTGAAWDMESDAANRAYVEDGYGMFLDKFGDRKTMETLYGGGRHQYDVPSGNLESYMKWKEANYGKKNEFSAGRHLGGSFSYGSNSSGPSRLSGQGGTIGSLPRSTYGKYSTEPSLLDSLGSGSPTKKGIADKHKKSWLWNTSYGMGGQRRKAYLNLRRGQEGAQQTYQQRLAFGWGYDPYEDRSMA